MLILTRRPQESLILGDAIKVSILEVNGNQVRIGIDAPKDVEVHREEIWLKIQQGKVGSQSPNSPVVLYGRDVL